MAMGGRGQREATSAIASCRPFSNSTGSLRGTRGATTRLGWLSSHQEARKIKELLGRATYVVWSYGTPIGFVSEDEDGERTAYYIDESHSPTTSHHQTLVRVGFSDFETIGEGPWSRNAPRGRRDGGMPPLDFGNRPGYVSETASGFGRRAEPGDSRFRVNHRGVRYDSLVERDTSFERDMAEARNNPVMAHPQEAEERYQAARHRAMEAELARPEQGYMSPTERAYLLDHRLSDPNWVPGRDPEADYAAEQRDAARVEREEAEKGPWRP